MSLSAYDTIAFNTNGKCSTGIFKNDAGDFLEIYKTWVYVHSSKMWKKDGNSFCKDTIAEFREGSLNLCGFEIQAKRGPQQSIFVYATWSKQLSKNKWKKFNFGGIGCYGYKNRVETVLKSLGREKDISDDWDDWSGNSKERPDKIIHCITNIKTKEEIIYWDESKDGYYDYGRDWTGVSPSTLSEFFKWLENDVEMHGEEFPDWVKKCKKAKPLRYNQGDAYFAGHVGKAIPSSKVGKLTVSILSRLIKDMAKKK